MKNSHYYTRSILIVLSLVLCTNLNAATYYTTGTGSWDSNIWNNGDTNGAGTAWATILAGLASGDVLVIDDEITLDGADVNLEAFDITIILDATLNLDKKLRLSASSTIEFTENGFLNPTGPGNSEKVGFGGTFVWSGDDGALTGPGSMDSSFDPATGLPIELGSFDANVKSDKVSLVWTTLSEINNDYFTVERSLNGVDYSILTTVDGAGNSESPLSYSYTDNNPSYGRSYYRLKQTDFDGRSETFAPVSVEYTSLKNGALSFRNPVKSGEAVSVYTNAEESEILNLSVFSMLGHEIINQKFKGSNYEFILDANVKPGIYFIKISSINRERTGRLVVQ